MELKIFKNIDEASLFAAEKVAAVVKKRPDAVLGLATGSSPIKMYAYLIDWYKRGLLDFSRVRSINLDEYIGLDGDHAQSYRYFMDEYLFKHINIDPQNTFLPNGVAPDLEDECNRYDMLWDTLGGTDIQVLGIGPNGHIGFNEPGQILRVGTHIEHLTANTMNANSRFFESVDEVPSRAITMGMGEIMRSKEVIVLAFGKVKAPVISAFANDDVTTAIPVTLIKLHPNATLIVDEEAASEL
ncbi:MAG TPA: glucosamine-6-phosphate deaminase [Clostridiaceae bacterium]|nr:glucosamine-6-phosphate deaminase [Clostridiaceae bacterium]